MHLHNYLTLPRYPIIQVPRPLSSAVVDYYEVTRYRQHQSTSITPKPLVNRQYCTVTSHPPSAAGEPSCVGKPQDRI